MGKVRILLFGDDLEAKWHPLQPVQEQLAEILSGECRLTATRNYEDLTGLNPREYAACISYADLWNRKLSSAQTAGLLKFVAGGGGLLAIHNGISLANRYELLQVIGAKFVAHPPIHSLRFYRAAEEHPILHGVDDFTLDEEPYQFEFDPHTPRNVLLEYEYDGKRWPSAWEHAYGLGKVVYLHPGHTAESLKPEPIRRFIANSVRWLTHASEK